MAVTSIYASVLALLYVGLSLRVIGARRGTGIALGDGGNSQLLRRQRVHGNFAEYVPLTLILMMLAELQGTALPAVHGIGCMLIAGHVLHAAGVGREPEQFWQRVSGMALTFSALISGALANLLVGPLFAGVF